MNVPPPENTLKLYLLGMNDRGRETMRMFLERHLSKYCQPVAMPDKADAVIFDADGYQAKEALGQHLLKFPQQQVIVLTVTPEEHEQQSKRIVRKPLDSAAFAEVLHELQQQLFTPAPAAPAA
ncbi:MAG: hypothetical protein KA972_07775, partial [Brachymonas sp.]|nr:hypothetical protein [Brachymonas sp.]